MNTNITIEGNLVSDVDLRWTKTGKAVCTVRLAVTARRKNTDGVYEDTPAVFYDAICWGPLAEHAVDSLSKGARVLVHGTSYDEEWTDHAGQTRVKHVLQVQAVGASLRYATVTVHRPTKTNTDAVEELSDAEVTELA